MSFKIVSDSAVNLRKINSEVPYEVVPLTVSTAERDFVDDSSLDLNDMLNYLKSYKGKSGSACPSVAAFLNAFGDAEEVLCVTITSNLSGSYNSARVAKEDYEAMHPGRRVYIVDSLSAGPEMNLIVEKLAELIDEGKDFDTICKEIAAYQEKTGLGFFLASLKNLANNGRVSPMVARLAGTLGICVVGKASDVGTLEPVSKCRGEKKTLLTLYKHIKEWGFAGGKMRIDHCENPAAAEQFKNMVLQEYPDSDIVIGVNYGLCSFYAEIGGLLVGFEKA